ncbi:MAG TPA: urate hydroxylase PuuD [Candidatus Eremiobacteraceae bacterium]|nr:urate hydroxylase PuuD [Candidatus Eremiobacteraceae bacterium]
MSSAIREWLNLGVRWFHVFSGILWVGQTYYFTWLDGQFSKAERNATDGKPSTVWMVHSGGFYTVEKHKSLGVAPELLRWFRWEAMLTWVSGLVLLTLVYYASSGLIDPDVAQISQPLGIVIGMAVMVGGWEIYDLAVRSTLGKSEAGFAVFAFLMTAAISWGLLHIFSARAAYVHLGALFGTIMTLNVWERILPAQRKMIAAAAKGAAFDAKLSAQAKLRSKHNTFTAVPVVFLMISNHFPVATYGNIYSWEILLVLVVIGWVAAKIIRSA